MNLYGFFGEITALDTTTFEIILSNPIPNMEGHLLNHYILPRHLWTRFENSPENFDNFEMVGSGPFKLNIYQQDSIVILTAAESNPLYAPKIQNVVFFVYPDETSVTNALQIGEIDLAYNLSLSALESLETDQSTQVVRGIPLNPTLEEIIINQINPANCPPAEIGGKCSGHPALRDQTFRQALAHATDKAKIIASVLFDSGTIGDSILPPGLGNYYNPNLQDYSFDINQANQLLDQAGYLDTDGDGIREMPEEASDNRALRFRFYYRGPSKTHEQISELLRVMWQQIGVALIIQEQDSLTLTDLCCPAYDYDLILWSWDVDPDPGFFLDTLASSKISTGYNETGHSNPNYDILNAIQHSETDEEKRLETIWALQEIAHNDVAQIVIYYPQTVQAYRKDRLPGGLSMPPTSDLQISVQ
ncbi:MAG: ABC transporter substrate-binding protein [Anaerolineae bacterium]|nr:ABC transporter substrate-binding protein [Anaerolineae bacterium]